MTVRVWIAACLALLCLPGTAPAGTVTLDGDRLQVRGSGGDNRLVIGRFGDVVRVEERNADERLSTPSEKCSSETAGRFARVECPAAGIRELAMAARGGNDWIVIGRGLPDSRGDRNDCRGSELGAPVLGTLGAGNDVAELSSSADQVRAGAGHDLVMGCGGNDLLSGGGDGDRVSGDRGDDRLRGMAGPDTVVGCSFDPDDISYPRNEPGDDRLYGSGGEDFLYGCSGGDRYSAGPGDDALNTRDQQDESVDCGDGADVIYLNRGDSRAGCETVTRCTTDNFPIGPDTGDPECFSRIASLRRR